MADGPSDFIYTSYSICNVISYVCYSMFISQLDFY
mgnify:CR=1 FL=1